MKQLDKAEEEAMDALQLEPNNPSAQETLADVFQAEGKIQEARCWLRKAQGGYEKKGEMDEATKINNKILHLAPLRSR